LDDRLTAKEGGPDEIYVENCIKDLSNILETLKK